MTNAVFLTFFIDFRWIFDETTFEKSIVFFTSASSFFNLATLTKHRNLRIKTHFFIFFFFFGKTGRTYEPKQAPKKVAKNDLPGTLLGPPNGPKSDQEHPKVTTKLKNH